MITPKEVNTAAADSLEYVFLVIELEPMSLDQLLQHSPNTQMTEEHVVILMYNLLCSMNFIHTANIMHRDIKPSNILIDGECRAKICDLGFARTMPKNVPYDDMDEYLRENAGEYLKAFNINMEEEDAAIPIQEPQHSRRSSSR